MAINRDRAARLLVDAIAFGDKTACKQHKVSERTLVRYRARLETDTELAALVKELGSEANQTWAHARLQFLRKALLKLDELLEVAKTSRDIKRVADAIKVVGELEVAAAVLNGGDHPHQSRPGPTTPPANSGAGKDRGAAAATH